MADSDPSIFKHSDQNDDELDVWNQGGFLLFHNTRHYDGGLISVRVDRCDVIRLYRAMGKWVSGESVPVCDPDSLYGQLIRQAVHEELARVIPECLAQTQAPVPVCTRDESCDVADDPHPLDVCRGGYGCESPGYHEAYGSGCGRSDPEPHDVGHPTYEDARPLARVGPSHCGECTHPMNDHIAFGGCWGNAGTCACEVQQDAPVPVVESDKVWGEAGQPPVACTCNPTALHPHDTNGCMHPSCTCKWVRG